MSHRIGRLSGLALLGVCCLFLALSGCLHYERDVTVARQDLLTADLAALTAQGTTREDIVTAFGQPRQALKLSDGTEVLVYVCEREERTNAQFLLGFTWDITRKQTIRYNFEMKDDVLVRFWTEDL